MIPILNLSEIYRNSVTPAIVVPDGSTTVTSSRDGHNGKDGWIPMFHSVTEGQEM
jgi:hypothetical protein